MTNEHDLDARLRAADPMAGVTPDLAAIRARVMTQVPTPIPQLGRRPKSSALFAVAASVALLAIVGGVANMNLGPRASVQMLTAADGSLPHQSVDTSTVVETFVSVDATSAHAACFADAATCERAWAASCIAAPTACTDVVTTSGNRVAMEEPELVPVIGLVAAQPWFIRAIPFLLAGLSALLLLFSLLRSARRQGLRRGLATGALLSALVMSQFVLPANPSVRLLSEPMGITLQGSWLVDLGARPGAANGVDLTLQCHNPGIFSLARGISLTCTQANLGSKINWSPRLSDGQHEIRVTAKHGMSWRLVAAWAVVPEIAWGVNTRGQTFGDINQGEVPDFISATPTNGRAGFVFANMLRNVRSYMGSPQTALTAQGIVYADRGGLPVYADDGLRVIGELSPAEFDRLARRLPSTSGQAWFAPINGRAIE